MSSESSFFKPGDKPTEDYSITRLLFSDENQDAYLVRDITRRYFILHCINSPNDNLRILIDKINTVKNATGFQPIFQFGNLADGRMFFVTSTVDNHVNFPDYTPATLKHRLEHQSCLDAVEISDMAIDLLNGIQQLHQLGIAHGNISIENIAFLDGHPVITNLAQSCISTEAASLRKDFSDLRDILTACRYGIDKSAPANYLNKTAELQNCLNAIGNLDGSSNLEIENIIASLRKIENSMKDKSYIGRKWALLCLIFAIATIILSWNCVHAFSRQVAENEQNLQFLRTNVFAMSQNDFQIMQHCQSPEFNPDLQEYKTVIEQMTSTEQLLLVEKNEHSKETLNKQLAILRQRRRDLENMPKIFLYACLNDPVFSNPLIDINTSNLETIRRSNGLNEASRVFYANRERCKKIKLIQQGIMQALNVIKEEE